MPGALPVLNKKVVDFALLAGLALNCHVNTFCKFDRKNYFYPDNPQNYQISQLYLPICHDGYVEIMTPSGTKKIGIHEIHMEEDAGKLIHDDWTDSTLVDYNRSGVPLIEIVSEPDMRSEEEVIAYLEKLQSTMQYLGVSDCRLQEGSMRADVNLSVRAVGDTTLGTRTEMKNLNSFKAISHAIAGERERQIELLTEGKSVIQETRRWDDNKEASFAMRSKEDAKDYRYFPDPDLPPIFISDSWISEAKEKLPEMREQKLLRYQKEYGLSRYDAELLTMDRAMAEKFETTILYGAPPKKAANWLTGETMRLMKEKERTASELIFSAKHLAELIDLIDKEVIQNQTAREVFSEMFESDITPEVYIDEHGLKMEKNSDLLFETAKKIVEANPRAVTEYKEGKDKVIGFLMGQLMREMKGKAAPSQAQEAIRKILSAY